MMHMRTLYLDFDGPLHPNAAHIDSRGPHLRPPFEYHELFEHAPILDSLIGETQDLQIIISSTWAMELGLQECIARLPARIAERVTGATWCHKTLAHLVGKQHTDLTSSALRSAWRRTSRYEQISAHAEVFGIDKWFALDDQDARWPDEERHRLVCCNEFDGLSRTLTRADFSRALQKMMGQQQPSAPVPRAHQ